MSKKPAPFASLGHAADQREELRSAICPLMRDAKSCKFREPGVPCLEMMCPYPNGNVSAVGTTTAAGTGGAGCRSEGIAGTNGIQGRPLTPAEERCVSAAMAVCRKNGFGGNDVPAVLDIVRAVAGAIRNLDGYMLDAGRKATPGVGLIGVRDIWRAIMDRAFPT